MVAVLFYVIHTPGTGSRSENLSRLGLFYSDRSLPGSFWNKTCRCPTAQISTPGPNFPPGRGGNACQLRSPSYREISPSRSLAPPPSFFSFKKKERKILCTHPNQSLHPCLGKAMKPPLVGVWASLPGAAGVCQWDQAGGFYLPAFGPPNWQKCFPKFGFLFN